MSEWRDISTAPKDGTAILLLTKAYTIPKEDLGGTSDEDIHHPPRCAIGCWNPEGSSWVDEYGQLDGVAYTLADTGTWSSGSGWFQPNEVTHWMPLPAPPPSELDR